MTINNVDSGKSQQQNAGRARFAGPELDSTGAWALPAPELSLTYKLPLQSDWLHALSMFANGSYITHRNLTTPALYFVDLPTTEIRAGIDYFPLEHFGLSSDLQYGSQRSSTSNGQYRTSPFTVFNLRGEVPVKWFTLYAGCTNVGNVNYSLSEGYPEEGRGFYGNISFNFKK
jgi:iron complex outermembrane receptor protein